MIFNPVNESKEASLFPKGFEAEIIPATYIGDYNGFPCFTMSEEDFSDNCGYLIVPRGNILGGQFEAYPFVAYTGKYSNSGRASVQFNSVPAVGVFTTVTTSVAHDSSSKVYRLTLSGWYPKDDPSLFPNSFILKFKF